MAVELMTRSGGPRPRGALKHCRLPKSKGAIGIGNQRWWRNGNSIICRLSFAFATETRHEHRRTRGLRWSWRSGRCGPCRWWSCFFGRWWWWGNGNTSLGCALAPRLARGSHQWKSCRRRWRWWHKDGWNRVGAAILCSMPSLAAQLARVKSVRTRASLVDAHRPPSYLASCLMVLAELRALWLHGWTNAGDTAKSNGKINAEAKNDSMRLHEDIVTTRGLEDVSKTKHKREAWRE